MFDFAGSLLYFAGLFSSCSDWRPLSSCGARASRGGVGFGSCGRWAQQLQFLGSRAQARPWCCQGLIVPWYVGPSQVRDRKCVSCIGRWTLYHWAIREALKILIIMNRVKDKQLKRWYSTPVQNMKVEDWFSILALQLTSHVTMNSLFNLSILSSSSVIDGEEKWYPHNVTVGVYCVIYKKHQVSRLLLLIF